MIEAMKKAGKREILYLTFIIVDSCEPFEDTTYLEWPDFTRTFFGGNYKN